MKYLDGEGQGANSAESDVIVQVNHRVGELPFYLFYAGVGINIFYR